MSSIKGLADSLEARLVVEGFCRAILSGDEAAVHLSVDPGYESTHRDAAGDFEALIRSVVVLRGIDRMITSSGSLQLNGPECRFGPVVVYPKISLEPSAADIDLRKTDSGWKVIGMREVEVPREFLYPLPESVELYDVEVQVRDASTGGRVAARVNITDTQGEYWPPLGHMKSFPTGHNEDVGGDVLVGGLRYAYVEPDFIAPLPEGRYRAVFYRGLEYLPASVDFEVPGSTVQVQLERWVDAKADGWYSGDTHVHFLSPQAALLEARGEDLNVVNILATQWSDYYTNVEHFTGRVNGVSEHQHIVYVGEESRHPMHGHTALLSLQRLVRPLAWGQRAHGYGEGTWHGHDHPTMATVADRVHDQGGFVAWAHMNDGIMDGELAIDVALGKIDGVEIFHFVDPFFESTWDGEPRKPTTELWYRFLNCGFRLPALAGTDKMFNRQIVGGVRTYVRLSEPLSYQAWIDGARAGRTFVTTGPMLNLDVNGQGVGASVTLEEDAQVRIRATVSASRPVDALEIVEDGHVVASVENPGELTRLEIDMIRPVRQSTWIAARAHGPADFRVQELPEFDTPGIAAAAHTSPVWLELNGRPHHAPADARFLAERAAGHIDWITRHGKFLAESHRQEVLSAYFQAHSILESLAEGMDS